MRMHVHFFQGVGFNKPRGAATAGLEVRSQWQVHRHPAGTQSQGKLSGIAYYTLFACYAHPILCESSAAGWCLPIMTFMARTDGLQGKPEKPCLTSVMPAL